MNELLPALIRYRVMGIILWMLSPFFVQAQLLDPVQFQIDSEALPDTVVSGERFIVTIYAEIEKDWYLYSIANDPGAGPFPTSFSSVENYFRIDGDITESTSDIKFDPNFDLELGLHSGKASFDIPIRFSSTRSGSTPFTIEVLYQACDDVSCLPPVRKRVGGKLLLESVQETEYDGSDDLSIDGTDVGFGVTSKSIENSNRGFGTWHHVKDLKFPVILMLVIILTAFFYTRGWRRRSY